MSTAFVVVHRAGLQQKFFWQFVRARGVDRLTFIRKPPQPIGGEPDGRPSRWHPTRQPTASQGHTMTFAPKSLISALAAGFAPALGTGLARAEGLIAHPEAQDEATEARRLGLNPHGHQAAPMASR
jgi:hypothetical protein